MKKTKSEVAVSKPQSSVPVNPIDGMISFAIEKAVPVDTMERLLAMKEKMDAAQAKSAFDNAMARFQGECPVIEKKKIVYNKGGVSAGIRYKYAPLDSIVEQCRDFIAHNGFSYSVDALQEPGFVTAVCKVTHELGHSQTSSFKIPIDPEGFMSAPQKFAAALTFAKRYAFCNAFGIMTGDEDTDATEETVGPAKPNLSNLPKPAPRAPFSKVVTPAPVAPAPKAPVAPSPAPSEPAKVDDKHLADFTILLETAHDQKELEYLWKTIPPTYQKALVPVVAEVKRRFASAQAAAPKAPVDLSAKREELKK